MSYRGSRALSAGVPTETLRARREGKAQSKACKGKVCNLETLPSKVIIYKETKNFLDKETFCTFNTAILHVS